jgi:hypothetical protein
MPSRSRSNVLLTELTIVVLFFSLIAVVVVQMFVAAHRQSGQDERLQRALIVAQNWAEQLSGRAEPAGALQEAGFAADAEGVYAMEDGGFFVEAELRPEEASPAGRLIGAEIRVFARGAADAGAADADALVALPVLSYIPAEEVARP